MANTINYTHMPATTIPKNKHLEGQREPYLKRPTRTTNQVSRRKLIPEIVVLTQMKLNISLTFL